MLDSPIVDDLAPAEVDPFTIVGTTYLWHLAAGYPDWYASSRAVNRPGYGRALYDLAGHDPVPQERRVYRFLRLQMRCLGQPLHRAKWSARHLPPGRRDGRSVELELRRRVEAENEHRGEGEERSLDDVLVDALVAAFLHDGDEIQEAARVEAGDPVNEYLAFDRFRSAICGPLEREVLGDGWRNGEKMSHISLSDESAERQVHVSLSDSLTSRPVMETPTWRRVEIRERAREAGMAMRAKMPKTADVFLARWIDELEYTEIVERGIAKTEVAARQAVSRAYKWIRDHRPGLSELMTS